MHLNICSQVSSINEETILTMLKYIFTKIGKRNVAVEQRLMDIQPKQDWLGYITCIFIHAKIGKAC